MVRVPMGPEVPEDFEPAQATHDTAIYSSVRIVTEVAVFQRRRSSWASGVMVAV